MCGRRSYHESVDGVEHGVAVRVVTSCKQLGRTDKIGVCAHAAE